ncbi:Uncharacterised protein [Legionella donaldsonii]|uniref:Uncharacterized protein n=1 Tax=Legionella donaldsonii TaxID=45060 RepID=A0A378J2I1_9GAMM|nr:hypothetical protein [Legionella donaldsonii]STX41478.1 Uncharacterised protein [Legionella donaldsonii]
MFTYTAKIYFDNFEITTNSGNKLESLFIWMLAQVQGKHGNLSGQVMNNKTHLIEKEFRACAYD